MRLRSNDGQRVKQLGRKKCIAFIAAGVVIITGVFVGSMLLHNKDKSEAAGEINPISLSASEDSYVTLEGEEVVSGGEYDNTMSTPETSDVHLKVGTAYFTNQETGEVDIENYMGEADKTDFNYRIEGNTVHLFMSRSFYNEFMERMDKSMMETVNVLVNGEGTEYVKRIQSCEDYKTVDIDVDVSLYQSIEKDYVPAAVGMAACIYQVFTPDGITGCDVHVVDNQTGNVLGTFHFPVEE